MIFRFVLGIALVALALWVIVGELITGASADATINARVVKLRAPIAGDLDFPARELGTIVHAGRGTGDGFRPSG